MNLHPNQARRQDHHALVVDDEEIVLVALRETLRQLGLQVTAVQDAVEALARLQQHPFSVVITDHQMPKLTGLEFLAQARVIQPNASRVLISAVLNLGTMIDAINRAEVFRFLVKPWQRNELIETIDAALRRFEAIEGLHQRLQQSLADNDSLTRRLAAFERESNAYPTHPRL